MKRKIEAKLSVLRWVLAGFFKKEWHILKIGEVEKEGKVQKKQKDDSFSICACHPCAGAMLIFSGVTNLTDDLFRDSDSSLERHRASGECGKSTHPRKKRRRKKVNGRYLFNFF